MNSLGHSMEIAAQTLFAANATILIVMDFAFLAAWIRQREVVYWRNWIIANLLIAASLVSFMVPTSMPWPWTMAGPLASVLLVAGYGTRWRAIRQFAGRGATWTAPVLFPALAAALLFSLPSLIPYEQAYYISNLAIAVTVGFIIFEIWRDRKDGLTSRIGLILSYSLIGSAFLVRGTEGMIWGHAMTGWVPNDIILMTHLSNAVVHTTSSGAFTLSLAYEKSSSDLRNAALTDKLTGLPNRRAFELQARGLHSKTPCALMIFDIDHFKRVNDEHGHNVGDETLRHCAQSMRGALRKQDFIARIGGEEFAAILHDLTAQDATEIAERVRLHVAACGVKVEDQLLKFTISIGVHFAPDGLKDLDEGLRSADRCLYAAKNAGRNRVEIMSARSV
ncbi:diguanylate cyclase (GGDEF)-like protein [Rhizobium sp. PP-CC-3A-592]|nr:diguanylate cyclase (GGDEF)-like protein [Rhizobium sp. PP-CC-3A-592]